MSWLEKLGQIEELEDCAPDADLIAAFEDTSSRTLTRPIRFSTPSFKDFETSELKGCAKNSFPAFSITGDACALNCDHCQANILKPMIPATTPEMLDQKVRDLVLLQDLQGFLLSSGSNRHNEIPEVYHLDRPVADFEQTLAALCTTNMEVVPHIVIGLHYGRIKGEPMALDIIARHDVHALVLVVVMPFYARAGTFGTPSTTDVGDIFLKARDRLPDKQVLLGCARPPGLHKRLTDAYAVMAGLDGIAFPTDGTVAVAETIGRPYHQEYACCSIKVGNGPGSSLTSPCAA
jgi:uncharacterized radical SAM superfamily protein